MVWDGSLAAGKTYDGHGLHGSSTQGLRKDLHLQWEPVWRHELDADFKNSLAYLKKSNVFQGSSGEGKA